uniref:CX domain-containing protein n=1 Tax=Trichobilharzia regenti TaxID=157069 RepID=A0AA85JC75_TRIRE|nr:unnamed protein product [Trichobilharzia regenti]
MGLKGLLVVVLVVVLLYDEVLAKSKSSRVWSSSRGGNVKPFSRSKPKYHHSSRSSMFSRRSGLSNSRKKALFFTAGALAGIYIGSRMRSAVHLRSYHDLYKYEVCEGRRTEYINATGMTRTYTYFLCPDDPNQPFERYCCWDTSTGMGVCCSYDVKVGAIVGALFGILFLGLVIGIFFYCCCRRKRQSVVMEPVDIPTGQPIPPVDPFYKPNQYPGMYPTQPVPSYPGYPYPPAGQGVVYIQNGSTPYPPAQPVTPTPGPTQIGSGWGGTADVNLSNQAARPNYPPPPYPGYPSSSPPPITDDPTVNPSAPSSAFMTKS